MNNKRRKEILNVINRIELKISAENLSAEFIKQENNVISNILFDEEEAFENMPESLQGSERGDISQEAQDNLRCAIDALDEAGSCLSEDNLDGVIDALEEAIICLEDACE